MADAPEVTWFYEDNLSEVALADFGVVDAGSASRSADPTIVDDPAYRTTFLIWNNRYHATNNSDGDTVALADMTNATITTVSLVRDGGGLIDPALSYQNTGPVSSASGAPEKQAAVEVIFRDTVLSEWGSLDTDDLTWLTNTWREIGGSNTSPIVAADGTVGQIAGAINTASLVTDVANYVKAKFRILVQPTATAGDLEFFLRASYQYTG